MTERSAFFHDQWVPEDRASLALDDWGLLQGAVVVERLRTCNLKALDLDDHLQRLCNSCALLGIAIPKHWRLAEVIEQCAHRHTAYYDQQDFSIVVLVTPGRQGQGAPGERPSLIVHTHRLDWNALHHWYVNGQPLIVSHQRNISPHCWSPHLKCRARLHYYLSDRQAEASPLQYAGAILLSLDNKVTETSVANLIIVDGKQRLVASPPDSVLQGISLKRTLRLAEKAGFAVDFQPISIETAGLASEILLTGSSGCLWPASRLGDISFQDPASRPVYSKLLDLWRNDIGLNFVQQAEQNAREQ